MRLDDRAPQVPVHIRQVANAGASTMHNTPAQHFKDTLEMRRVIGDGYAKTEHTVAQLVTGWRIRQFDAFIDKRAFSFHYRQCRCSVDGTDGALSLSARGFALSGDFECRHVRPVSLFDRLAIHGAGITKGDPLRNPPTSSRELAAVRRRADARCPCAIRQSPRACPIPVSPLVTRRPPRSVPLVRSSVSTGARSAPNSC